ncbi:uncharacterized protein ACN2A1_003214 isoform 1-T1 [Glossina fuscipes fuscipes]
MQHIDAKHCVLEVDSKEEIFIVDLESDSGVYGNNKRVGPLTKERLQLDEDFGLGEQLKAQIKRRDASNVSLDCPRSHLPSTLRNTVFRKLHNISHPGRYFWPGMNKKVKDQELYTYAEQKSKVCRHTKSTVTKIAISKAADQRHILLGI